METVRLTLTNGESVTLEHNSVDRTFDDIMQFSDTNYVVKTGELRIPLRSILTYQVKEQIVAKTVTEESNG